MKLLHTSMCCWCVDLRTAGLIIGYLGIIGSVLNVAMMPLQLFIGALINVLLSAALIYGIHKKKPDFVLPLVAWHIFFLCVLVLSIVIFLITSIVGKQLILNMMKEYYKAQHHTVDDRSIEAAYGLTVVFSLVFMSLSTALLWHFTSVLYSLWKNMKEGGSPNVAYKV